jgi:cell division transport system ATP-binding protein
VSSESESPIVDAENLTRLYPRSRTPALQRVTLKVQAGEFVFLTGESGSGKTTLIRALLLERQNGAGRLRIFGRDVRHLSRRRRLLVRRHIGTIFQDYKLIPELNVVGNVAFPLRCEGASRRSTSARVHEALELVGLASKSDARPHELSGGEQQRVAIARALAGRPKLLLADEPTGNLDPDSSKLVFELLDEINRAGTTVIVTTHDEDAVDRMRRRVARLHHGQLISDRTGGYR